MSTATTAVTPVGNNMDLTDSTALAAGVGVTATEFGGRLVAPVGAGGGLGMPWGYPPINLIYQHFHNSIRAELDALSELAKGLDGAAGAPLQELLQSLRVRYQFMEQVYRYHSSVEDEVVYPALDSKVKNVTLAYSVEHEDEVNFLGHQSSS
jgi:zinc finger-like protein